MARVQTKAASRRSQPRNRRRRYNRRANKVTGDAVHSKSTKPLANKQEEIQKDHDNEKKNNNNSNNVLSNDSPKHASSKESQKPRNVKKPARRITKKPKSTKHLTPEQRAFPNDMRMQKIIRGTWKPEKGPDYRGLIIRK